MKTKKITLVLSLLSVLSLAGCGEEEAAGSSPDDNVQVSIRRALLKAKGNVNFAGDVSSIYIEDSESGDEGTMDFTIGENVFEWKKTFKDINNSERIFEYSFEANENGNLAYKKLNLQNEVELQEYSGLGAKKALKYTDYCLNPFKNIEPADLTLIEGRYFISEKKVSSFNGLMSLNTTTNYNFYDVEASSVSLTLNGDEFKDIVITTKPRKDISMNPADFILDASFTLYYPAEVTPEVVTKREHKAEHDNLKKALEALQKKLEGQNYTITTRDVTSDGEIDMTYNTFATADAFYCDFRPAIENYCLGYNKGNDGKFHWFRYYLFDNKNPKGEIINKKGDVVYFNPIYNPKNAIHERKELEPDFLSFAVEFFNKTAKGNFVCSNADVVDAIHRYISPFYDKQDEYYTADKVFFNMNAEGEIETWGFRAESPIEDSVDTFTFTLKDIGTTVLPMTPTPVGD